MPKYKGCKDKKPRKQKRPIGWSRTDSRGYVWVKVGPGRAYKKRCWIIMEQHLGRSLLPGEEVHHKNGIKNDDQSDNLEVLTKSQHSSFTATLQHGMGNFGRAAWSDGSDSIQRQSMSISIKRWHQKRQEGSSC